MKILQGDCLKTLQTLDAGIVQTCVTSPPYYGLRDYGMDAQIGLEKTPDDYVDKLVQVFREVRRVLRDDGVLWLNLGDSYAASSNTGGINSIQGSNKRMGAMNNHKRGLSEGLKPKDLIGIPWMVAFALRADGWYLRSDIIWHKPNPMPESVTDRPTKSHEYIFLMSKSANYYYDADAIKEPLAQASISRLSQDVESQTGSSRVPGKTNGNMKAVVGRKQFDNTQGGGGTGLQGHSGNTLADGTVLTNRNKRSVWTVTTKPYSGAHFATFPPDLIEPCILAGSKVGDIVLDPFGGSGTTAAVAVKHHRDYILCELNSNYIDLSNKRLAQVQPVLMGIAP